MAAHEDLKQFFRGGVALLLLADVFEDAQVDLRDLAHEFAPRAGGVGLRELGDEIEGAAHQRPVSASCILRPQLPSQDATCRHRGSTRRDAHELQSTVQYPWHALHGQVLGVEHELTADGERVYVIALGDESLTHLPVWMTEPAAAIPATLVAAPRVSVVGLAALRRLLDTRLDPAGATVDARRRL